MIIGVSSLKIPTAVPPEPVMPINKQIKSSHLQITTRTPANHAKDQHRFPYPLGPRQSGARCPRVTHLVPKDSSHKALPQRALYPLPHPVPEDTSRTDPDVSTRFPDAPPPKCRASGPTDATRRRDACVRVATGKSRRVEVKFRR